MKALKWVGIIFGLLIAIYLGVATWAYSGKNSAPFEEYPISEDDWRALQAMGGTDLSQDVAYDEQSFMARDGTTLAARVYGGTSVTKIVYLHGVGSNAGQMNNSAGLLASATGAQIITPDARGHGASEGARYNVDHIGQYEEDLADIIAELRKSGPEDRIIVAGHSMGGGVALRFALLKEKPAIDGHLLFAPNFGDGPTQHPAPENAGTEDDPIRGIVYFDQRAFIGTLMYNIIGITLANDTPVLFFNAPDEPVAYTYDAILSAQPTAPQDSTKALAAVDVPMLVMIGAYDEVFKASAYEEFVSTYSDGKTIVVPGLTHNSLINDPAVMEMAASWLQERPLP